MRHLIQILNGKLYKHWRTYYRNKVDLLRVSTLGSFHSFPFLQRLICLSYWSQKNLKKKIPWSVGQDTLARKQRLALKELKNLKEAVIKPTDKEGNIMAWAKKNYE